jgi:hypothetical protein
MGTRRKRDAGKFRHARRAQIWRRAGDDEFAVLRGRVNVCLCS